MVEYLKLRVSGPQSLDFYTKLLGFEEHPDCSYRLPGQRFGLRFDFHTPSVDYTNEPDHGYWKIGFTTANVDLARRSLTERGWEVSEPRQFRDIGYMCHLKDADGLVIELLQHNFGKPEFTEAWALRLAHVTLRVATPEASLSFYRTLGFKLLSVQPVEPYRFTLYFLAQTEELPPEADLEAVQNRPWLWRRPYPVLELQHCWDREPRPAQNTELGYVHLALEGGCKERFDPDGHALLVC